MIENIEITCNQIYLKMIESLILNRVERTHLHLFCRKTTYAFTEFDNFFSISHVLDFIALNFLFFLLLIDMPLQYEKCVLSFIFLTRDIQKLI